MRGRDFINTQIVRHYATEDNARLANRLGISEGYLRLKAKRLGVKKPRTNDILEGELKKCPHCNFIKPLHDFNRDRKYQLNGYDYYCKSCRALMRKLKERDDTIENGEAYTGSLAFNKVKSTPPLIIDEEGQKYFRCKSCELVLHIENYDNNATGKHGKHYYCKTCRSLKRKGVI